MEEYTVKLIQSCVTKFKADIEPSKVNSSALSMQSYNSLRPPTDPEDPTVLIVSEIEMEDKQPDHLKISCELQCIFSIDPIPEDRLKVVSEKCPPLIRIEALRTVEKTLNAMGHPIHFNSDNDV